MASEVAAALVPDGVLSVRVIWGVNLVQRDADGSDPYVVLHLDSQKLKTSVVRNTINPVWNEDLTLAVKDPSTPIKLVYDKDRMSKDDAMGTAEVELEPLLQMARMDLEDIKSGTVVRTVRPHSKSCLADESQIVWEEGQVLQEVLVRLKDVDTGIVQLQLRWVKIPAAAA
ncbi:hypothetical protein BRADI_1g59232v3 [Brachypodium distachyon]|uniref:C2 domain-containing protein n=1 Tax=Brachypodium distachyon TaxID=15368 RepID=A0A0Q3HF88_BRADI|nr:hypothetical protein BRADI_1g59232v3 [Brachypodium distachyon]